MRHSRSTGLSVLTEGSGEKTNCLSGHRYFLDILSCFNILRNKNANYEYDGAISFHHDIDGYNSTDGDGQNDRSCNNGKTNYNSHECFI